MVKVEMASRDALPDKKKAFRRYSGGLFVKIFWGDATTTKEGGERARHQET